MDGVVCLPGARIEHVTERVEQITGRGNGGSILVHIRTNSADKEGTTSLVEKYRNRLKKMERARLDRSYYQEFYQCLETGSKDTGIRSGWQSNGGAALQGRIIGTHEFVTGLCGKKTCA